MMVRVKGGEWGHVSVVKEPAKHGMAWHVQCSHCGKVFQGNAMRIRSHLLGHPDKVSGCPSCPAHAREELRVSYLARSQQVERKKKPRHSQGSLNNNKAPHHTTTTLAPPPSQLQQHDGDGAQLCVQQVFRSMAVHHAGEFPATFANLLPLKSMMPSGDVADLEFFLDGFGIRAETINKIKEMGFTGKTFMSNLDELLTLLESIKQHCQLTLGEEWGIKGAAKKWHKEHGILKSQPEFGKCQDSENKSASPPGCMEEVLNLQSSLYKQRGAKLKDYFGRMHDAI